MIWIDLYHYSIPLCDVVFWYFNYNIYICSYWIIPNGYYKMCTWNFCQEFNMLHILWLPWVHLVFLMIYVRNVLFKSISVEFHSLPVEITPLKRIYRVHFIQKSLKIQDTLMEVIKYVTCWKFVYNVQKAWSVIIQHKNLEKFKDSEQREILDMNSKYTFFNNHFVQFNNWKCKYYKIIVKKLYNKIVYCNGMNKFKS